MPVHACTPGTLSVIGEGQVKAKPDVAILHIGVQTTSENAQDAVARNAELMSRVMDAVKSLNVRSEDLQTVGFDISPIMDYTENSPTFGKIIEYRVEDVLSVRVGIHLAAQVLDEAVAAGATVAGNLTFSLRNEAPARKKALAAAVAAARRDAEATAAAMGIKLKGTHNVEVMYSGAPVITRGALRAEKASTTPLAPGILTVSAHVRILFKY